MPSDVVIIGGGLSGLAAAYELEQHKLDYTLIEVKRRLGGSIRTIEQDGFRFDSMPFALVDNLEAEWLAALGLQDALFSLEDGIAFKQGHAALIDALAQRLIAPRLMRMAVSSIGELENGRFSICLENGLLLDAATIIIAIPARYAEHLFYGYITELTEALLDYRYDSIQRVSLGYHAADVPPLLHPPDMAYVSMQRTDHPSRVPQGGVMLQFGLRIDPQRTETSNSLVQFLTQQFDLPQPLSAHISYWAEADPISCYDDRHAAWIKNIRDKLPQGIVLIGSDYSIEAPMQRGMSNFRPRIQQGQQAAQHMRDFLRGK